MELQTSKNLGGIGALLITILGPILLCSVTLFSNLLLGIIICGITEIIGISLILASLYSLAKFYKDTTIFNNALLGALTAIIGSIISGIITTITVITTMMNAIRQIYPDWNGTDQIQNLTPDLSNIDYATLISHIGSGLILAFLIFTVFTSIAAFFIMRALKRLAIHSHKETFATIGLLIFIGAICTIFVIGIFLIWIAILMLAIAFFKLKEPDPAQPSTTETTTPLPTIDPKVEMFFHCTPPGTLFHKFCPNCSTPITSKAKFCTHCGKQI